MIKYTWLLTALFFIATTSAYAQQIYTPTFQIRQSNITTGLNTVNIKTNHPEICNEEFVCSGKVSAENADFVWGQFPYKYGVSPMHISFNITYDGPGYPRLALVLNTSSTAILDSSVTSNGHYTISMEKYLSGYYLDWMHSIDFIFFVVDEEYKDTPVTSVMQLFVPVKQIFTPLNGVLSFSMEATFEQTNYIPDLEPMDPGAVSADQSYIRTRTMTNTSGTSYLDEYTYYDGLGRAIQTVQQGATPSGADIVTMQQYDGFGRKHRSWLPVAVAGNNGAYLPLTRIMFEAKGNYAGDRKTYSFPVYEASPLEKVTEQYGPGEKWQIPQKAVRIRHFANDNTDTLRCIQFKVSEYGTTDTVMVVSNAGNYAAGEMAVIREENEDGNTSYVFRNKREQIVLVRQILNNRIENQITNTYYLYDGPGNLRVVLPPMASARMQNGGEWASDTTDVLRQYAYLYKYDHRDRCTYKRLPGVDWIRYVYDRADNPILSQDGEQRRRDEWSFSVPDIFGRIVLSGICKNTIETSAPLSEITVRAVPDYENTNALAGYYIDGITLVTPNHVTAYYYDDYNFLNLPEFSNPDLRYEASGIDSCLFTRYGNDTIADAYMHKGLLTGTRRTNLNSGETLHTTIFYDIKKRPIQTKCIGYGDIALTEYRTYDFTGKPLQFVEKHTIDHQHNLTQKTDYLYDHAGRIRSAISQIFPKDGNTAKATLLYAYDELGRLVSTSYGSGTSATEVYFSYNLRGWLTEQQSEKFSLSLAYETPKHALTTPSFSGNITEWSWLHGEEFNEQTYAFSYDGLSRLTDTKQYVNDTVSDRFVERGLLYDRNGNILSLQRTEDNLPKNNFTYTYVGNRLMALSDSITAETYTYAYDSNGNLTHDGPNNLDLQYNHLNLLEKAEQNGTTLANYSYLSDGTKLSATDGAGNGLYYVGSLVYRKQGETLSLESVGFDGGRFVAEKTSDGATYSPHYYLTDHLGSVRAVIDGSNGEVLERNDYYPFGLRWSDPASQFSDNRYRYNGKEEQSFLEVPYIDYGARMYDPKYRLSWGGVDPLAETTPDSSPFAFSNNNPLRFVDHFGLQAEDTLSVNQIQRVVVTGKRNPNPLSGGLMFILNSASSWGKLYNDAFGNTEATFEQNMNAGLDIWSQFFVGYGFSKLGLSFKGVKRAKLSKGLKLPPERLNHIMQRHGPTSQATDAGKFLYGFNKDKLINMINTTIEYGAKVANTKGRPGHIYTYDFNTTIGITNKGNPTSVLKVVTNNNNEIITVFPYF